MLVKQSKSRPFGPTDRTKMGAVLIRLNFPRLKKTHNAATLPSTGFIKILSREKSLTMWGGAPILTPKSYALSGIQKTVLKKTPFAFSARFVLQQPPDLKLSPKLGSLFKNALPFSHKFHLSESATSSHVSS